MNQNLKNFIEEGEKEFEEVFCYENLDNDMIIRYELCQNPNRLQQELKDFISSRQISLIKMIVELIEEAKNLPPSTRANTLDTISSKLKEIYEEKISR